MKRTIWSILTALLLSAVLLTACAPGGGPSPTSAGETSPAATQGSQGYPSPGADSSTYPAPGQVDSSFNPYPGPSQGVNNYLDWATVEELIMGGKVAKVYHAQSMHITLVLKDGSVGVSIEPVLDEVFKIIERCGQACSDIEQIKE